MSKIKIFLGGYINYTNAQNINCKSLANSLDQDQFEIFTLETYLGDKIRTNVNLFTCFKPFSISKQLGFLWGIYNCDVAYLPKHIDTPLWCIKLAKFLNKKIFTTIEGNVANQSIENLISLFGGRDKMQNHFKYFDKIYAITSFLIDQTKNILRLEDTPLFLGVDSNLFTRKNAKQLCQVVFIGGLIKRKKVYQILKLAKQYPDLKFSIIGDGLERKKLEEESTSNVIFHGMLNHKNINKVLLDAELMILPAESEGFPKVILEAASAGVPSVVYSTYGAHEWIDHNLTGFIANQFDDIIDIIDTLILNQELLQLVSRNTITLSNKFDWQNVIKEWEKVITDLYYEE